MFVDIIVIYYSPKYRQKIYPNIVKKMNGYNYYRFDTRYWLGTLYLSHLSSQIIIVKYKSNRKNNEKLYRFGKQCITEHNNNNKSTYFTLICIMKINCRK